MNEWTNERNNWMGFFEKQSLISKFEIYVYWDNTQPSHFKSKAKQSEAIQDDPIFIPSLFTHTPQRNQ